MIQKQLFSFLLLLICSLFGRVEAQPAKSAPGKPKKTILVDIAHGQRFYNNPATMVGDSAFIERVKYITGELDRNAKAHDASVTFHASAITSAALQNTDLLFIHMPSAKFTPEEVKAIHQYLNSGGSMFMVMEVDYWARLEQSNVNDIVNPYGIVYKENNPDGKSSGGYSESSPVVSMKFSIPYHGARIVEGGTPFCYSNETRENPFGVYKEVGKGGKIVAMGDGMVSLYMTSWEGVTDYQCSDFMNVVVGWLLK